MEELMFSHLLTLGFCSLLLASGYGAANAEPEQRSDQPAVQARDAQIVHSSTAAIMATTPAQPRQANQAGDATTEAIRAPASWIKWPSLTDF
jgi:hypothetical protein